MDCFLYDIGLRCDLRYIEIITVKSVALCKKLLFFHKKSKKHENETDTSYVNGEICGCNSRKVISID